MSADFPGNLAVMMTVAQVIGLLLWHSEAQQVQLVALPRRLDQAEAMLTSRLGPPAAPGKPPLMSLGSF